MLDAFVQHEATMAPWAVVIVVAWVAAVCDLLSRRIPNWLTYPTLIGGVGWAFATRGFVGVGDAVLGGLLAALPYVLLFLFAGGGAGDAKMMAAIGSWLGVLMAAGALLAVAIVGGLLAVTFAVLARRWRQAAHNLGGITRTFALAVQARQSMSQTRQMMPRTSGFQTMPYGVAIYAGVCVAALGAYLWHG